MAINFISIVIRMHNYVLCNNIMCGHKLTLWIIHTLHSSHSQQWTKIEISYMFYFQIVTFPRISYTQLAEDGQHFMQTSEMC